jgi:hypothetical protein
MAGRWSGVYVAAEGIVGVEEGEGRGDHACESGEEESGGEKKLVAESMLDKPAAGRKNWMAFLCSAPDTHAYSV